MKTAVFCFFFVFTVFKLLVFVVILCYSQNVYFSQSSTLFACFQSQTASENVGSLWNPWVQLFVCENAGLIVKLNEFFTTLSSSNIADKLPPELAGEWTDFFVEGIYNLLLPLPVSITGMCGYDVFLSNFAKH